jgi:Protein of unknown function (DUF3073)
MGRGRAKAKQTKVARQLKYTSPDTDLDALQRELSGGPSEEPLRRPPSDESDEDDDADDYDGYADDDSESADDSEGWRAAR